MAGSEYFKAYTSHGLPVPSSTFGLANTAETPAYVEPVVGEMYDNQDAEAVRQDTAWSPEKALNGSGLTPEMLATQATILGGQVK